MLKLMLQNNSLETFWRHSRERSERPRGPDALSDALESYRDALESVHESLASVIDVPENGVEENINEALDTIVNAPEGIVDALGSAVGALENVYEAIRSVVSPKVSNSLQRCCKCEHIHFHEV